MSRFFPLLAFLILAVSACSPETESETSQAVTEAQREGKQFTRMGFEVQCRAGAGRWKFDHIPDWEAKKFELSQLEEKAKWAFKSAEKGITPIDEDGVIVEAAIYTPGADTIALKEVQP